MVKKKLYRPMWVNKKPPNKSDGFCLALELVDFVDISSTIISTFGRKLKVGQDSHLKVRINLKQ